MSSQLQNNLAYIELLRIMDSLNPDLVSTMVEQMADQVALTRNRNIEITVLLNRLIVSLQQKDFADITDVYRTLYALTVADDTHDS
jgi:hypothetical protein